MVFNFFKISEKKNQKKTPNPEMMKTIPRYVKQIHSSLFPQMGSRTMQGTGNRKIFTNMNIRSQHLAWWADDL